MSEFKFSCPVCGQHLTGDARYSGLQITCPNCQDAINVPAPPAFAAGPPPPPAANAPTPPPVPQARMAAVSPARTCGLAIASLICSCLGVSIAGIICGHMAKSRIRREPSLGGRGLATAGLIVGYLGLALGVVVVGLFLITFMFAVREVKQAKSVPFDRGSEQMVSANPRRDVPVDATPDGSGWTLQLSGVGFPAEPVKGRIHGREFTPDRVALENGWLKFRQGTDFFPDLGMEVVLFVDDPAKLSGKSVVVPKAEFGATPHIWMKWKNPNENVPQNKTFVDGYALRLEFGQLASGKLPGKIYLCLPDAEKSFSRGTFEVPVKPH